MSTRDLHGSGRGASAYRSYFEKLRPQTGSLLSRAAGGADTRFDPTVVASRSEYRHMVCDIATRQPMVLQTVVLPQGMTMNDPRLRGILYAGGEHTEVKLPPGEMPDLPKGIYLADLKKSFVPPRFLPDNVKGDEVRFQVLPRGLLAKSEDKAARLLAAGHKDHLKAFADDDESANELIDTLSFSPQEDPQNSMPHYQLAPEVKKAADTQLQHARRNASGKHSHIRRPSN